MFKPAIRSHILPVYKLYVNLSFKGVFVSSSRRLNGTLNSETATHNGSTSNIQSGTVDFYKLFPKTFPNGPPPNSPFQVDLKKLKKEFRLLQQQSHPDILHGSVQLRNLGNEEELKDQVSALLNKAYSTLKSSLSRAQYILKEKASIDLNSDEEIQEFQFKDKSLLMFILEIHEELENVTSETELKSLKEQNDERIVQSENTLADLFAKEDYESAALELVKLKYWFNIANAIKNWEYGKPVNLTH